MTEEMTARLFIIDEEQMSKVGGIENWAKYLGILGSFLGKLQSDNKCTEYIRRYLEVTSNNRQLRDTNFEMNTSVNLDFNEKKLIAALANIRLAFNSEAATDIQKEFIQEYIDIILARIKTWRKTTPSDASRIIYRRD